MHFLSRSQVLGYRLRKVAAKERAFLCIGAARRGNELADFADVNNLPIFQVMTIHNSDRSTWNIVMKDHDFAALIEDSKEVELLPGIKFDHSQQIIVKTRQSTFIRTDFEEKLIDLHIDTLILCGVFTHGCVGRTAIDAYERDFHVIIASDASFSHVKDQEKAMFEVIEGEQEQIILSNDDVFNTIERNQ